MGILGGKRTGEALRAGRHDDGAEEERKRRAMLISSPSARAVLLLSFLIAGAPPGRAGQQPRVDPDIAAAQQATSQGRKADAERILSTAFEKAEREAPESPRTALLLNNLGGLYLGEGRYEEAEKSHARALAILTKIYGPDDPHLVSELDNLGVLYGVEERLGEAEKMYKRAFDIVSRSPQGNMWQRGMLAGNLAQFYSRQHRYAEAQVLLEGELALMQDSARPEDSLQVVRLRRLLAQIYQAEAKPDEADRVLQQLTPPIGDAGVRNAGLRAVAESERLMSLGDIARERGDLPGAEDYYNQAMAGFEATKGVNALYALSEALVKLGEVYRQQGSDRDAERVFRQALDLADDYPRHPGSGALFPLFALLNLYRDEHRLTDINPDFERTLSAQEKDLGPSSPSLVPLLNAYASVEQEEGDLDRAESLYHQALEIQQRNLSPHDLHLAGALTSYAGVLEALGRKDEAAAARARAEAIRKEKEAESPSKPRGEP